ncbi:MAG: YfhO family protein [bacterium]|nr:YfhO family protein [bacterium]
MLILCAVSFYPLLFTDEIVNATDILTQRYFWNVFVKENLLADPCFRTWMPYVNAGTPFSGGLDVLFRPVYFLTLLVLPVHTGINYECVIYLFLAGFFMYFYMKELRLSTVSAFFAALFLMLSGQIVSLINAGHMNKLAAIVFTPLVFWMFERALRRQTLSAFLGASLALGIQFWQGHIQISYYTCLAVGIYYVIRIGILYLQEREFRQIRKLTAYALLMVIVFLLLSAVTFLPTISFARVSDRAQGVSYEFATSWSMPPEELISYLIPNFFGLRRLNYHEDEKIIPYWGRMPFTQTGHYLGLLPILFAILTLCFVRNKHVLTLTVLGGLVLILGMGKYIPTYKLLYAYMPGFDKFRVPQMILFLFAFALSGLAGFGIEWFLVDFSKKKEKRLRIVVLVLIAILLFSWLLLVLEPLVNSDLLTLFNQAFSRKGASQEIAQERLNSIFSGILLFNMVLGFSLFVLALRLNAKVRLRWVIGLLVLVFIFDMGLFNSKYIDTVSLETSHYARENNAIRYFKENPGLYRVLPTTESPEGYGPFNKFVAYQIFSVTGYEAVGVQYYNEFLGQLFMGSPLVDMLNIKYIILPREEEQPIKIGDKLGPYSVVMHSDALLLENPNYLPRAFPVHNVEVLTNKDDIFKTFYDPQFNPRETVILEEAPDVQPAENSSPSSTSEVEIEHYFNRKIEMSASMVSDGFLVLSERYYPGWKAYVNGQPTPIYKADYTLQAIFLPKGEHDILFSFQPTQFILGFSITLLTACFLAGVWLYRHTSLRTYGAVFQQNLSQTVARSASRSNSLKLLWGLLAVGLIVHTAQYLFNRSLYVDEISLALNILQRSFRELLQPLDYHQAAPIGFLWVERLMLSLFGEHEYALRFFPFASAILSIFLFARIAQSYLRRSAALFAVALFVMSEPLIFFSSTVKQYSCDVFFVLLLYVLAHSLQTSRVAWSTAAWIGFAGAIIIWFSHPAIFVLASIGVTLTSVAFIRRERHKLGPLLLATCCWALSFLGFYLFSLQQLGENEYLSTFWQGAFLKFPPGSFSDVIAPVTRIFQFTGYATGYSQAIFDSIQSHSLSRLFEYIRQLLTSSQTSPLSLIFPFLFLALSCTIVYILMFGSVIVGGISMSRRAPVALGLLSLPLCGVFAASALQKFPLGSRVLLFYVPMLLLMMGEGISVIWRKLFPRFPLLAVMFLIAIIGYPLSSAVHHLLNPRTDQEIRPVLRYVHDHAEPDDTLYIYYASEGAFKYYGRRFDLDGLALIQGIAARNDWEAYVNDLNQLHGKGRVWLVFSHVFGYEEKFFVQYLENNLGAKRIDMFRRPKAAAYLYDL